MKGLLLTGVCLAIAVTAWAQPGKGPPPKAPTGPVRIDPQVMMETRFASLEKKVAQLEKELAAATALNAKLNSEVGAAKLLITGLDKAAGESKTRFAAMEAKLKAAEGRIENHTHAVGIWMQPITHWGKTSNSVTDLVSRTGMLVAGISDARYKQDGGKIVTGRAISP